MQGIVKEMVQVENEWGISKQCKVDVDGSKKTVYVSEKAKTIYDKVAVGSVVELAEKDNGKGHLISSILPAGSTPANGQALAVAGIQPWHEATGEEIKERTEKAVKLWVYAERKAEEAGLGAQAVPHIFNALTR